MAKREHPAGAETAHAKTGAHKAGAAPWPQCRGAVAALIRSGQWRISPLGAIGGWPQVLKTAVEIMLQGRQPAFVCWGRALTTLYNDAAVATLGARHPLALGRPYAEIFPETWDDLKPVLEAALAGEAQHVVGQRMNRGSDHPPSWRSYTWTPLRDEDGKVEGLYCAATETNLQIGDEQLRTVLENARDAVSMLDLDTGKYVFISPSHTALTGFSAEELKSFTPSDFFARLHPDDRSMIHHPKPGDGDGFQSHIEYRWKVKSGEFRWFSVNRKLVHDAGGKSVALVNVIRDVTERKRAEMEISSARATLEAALSSMTDGVCITDTGGRIIHANDAFTTYHRYHGPCPDNFRDIIKDFDVYFPDGTYAPVEQRSVARALRGETGVAVEYVVRRKDTGERWSGSYSFGPIRDANGTVTGAVLTARDITEAREAAEALRRSETRLSLALESAEMATWEWEVNTDRAVWSVKLYELLGLPPRAEEVGTTFFRHVHPDDLPDVERSLKEVIASGRDWRAEFRVIRPDGSVRWLIGVGRLIRNPDGSPNAMFGVNYDVSDQKRAEAELKQSEARTLALREQLLHVGRVSELSQVSAGIAHELNQPLAAILNYSATAKRLIAKKDHASIEAAAKAIAHAGEQATRAGDIIRRMRDFVEKRHTHRQPDDINAIVKEAADLGLIGAKADGIETVLDLSPDLPQVIADRVQIEQVLVNLLHNAVDAMAGAETRHLTLSTGRVDGRIEVVVTDTGHGIPSHLVDRLFQPFVTNKPTGMGIGLAISRSIIEAHGGEIDAISSGGGTVFRFTLPAAH